MKFALGLSLLLSVLVVHAEDVYSEQFQKIHTVELYEVIEGESGVSERRVSTQKSPDLLDILSKSNVVSVNSKGILMMAKNLIALGKEIYKIVEKGRPVVTTSNFAPIEVLAKDDKGEVVTALDMTGWNVPKGKKYKIVMKNYMGINTVTFEFLLIYSYGGQYRSAGRYITGAQIKPSHIDVKWGYTFDANFKLDTIVNQGSDEDPVAGAVLAVEYKIDTVFQHMEKSQTFFINGLGQTTAY